MAPQPVEKLSETASQATSNVSSASSSLWDRICGWASENKTTVYTVAGITVVATGAGVLYYFSSSTQEAGGEQGPKKSKKDRRKAKKEAEEAANRADQFQSQPSVEPEEELPQVDESTIASLSEEVYELLQSGRARRD